MLIILGKFSMLRIIRLLRVVRTSRTIRMGRFVRELRLMVYSLAGAMKTLGWAVVLIAIIIAIFGVYFTDGAVVHLEHHRTQVEANQALRMRFGALSSASLSLYMGMSGGVDWTELWEALGPLPAEYKFALLMFVTFSILALLNVITAVFVETAMQRSQNDRELLVQQELEQKVEFVDTLQRVFEELDANGSGSLTMEEFERQIQDEHILTYLSTLEIEVDQVRMLLPLLDLDRNGEVDIDEFINGCIRLKGGARSLDVGILQYQIEWLLHNMNLQSAFIEERFERIFTALERRSPSRRAQRATAVS